MAVSAEDAFDLVLPSLPGYGFSAEPAEVGWDLFRTARAWAELMRRLGYTSYVAQGGDVGAGVTDAMSRQAPEGLIGVHTNLLVPALNNPAALPADTEQEKAALAAIKTFQTSGNGYFVEQSTRPQTIGYALLDSPVALAAWMVDHDTDAYYKIARRLHRRQAVGQPHPRSHPRQRHDLLADRHRRFGSAVVLGGLRARRACCRPEASAGVVDPVRLHDVPGRDLADAAQLGRGVVPERRLLQRGRQGWPLRRVGGARALQQGDARGVQIAALKRADVSTETEARVLGRSRFGLSCRPVLWRPPRRRSPRRVVVLLPRGRTGRLRRRRRLLSTRRCPLRRAVLELSLPLSASGRSLPGGAPC